MNTNSEIHFIVLLWTVIVQHISVFSGSDAEMLHLSFCTVFKFMVHFNASLEQGDSILKLVLEKSKANRNCS